MEVQLALPLKNLQPLRPPTTLFRTDRPPLSYGYVIASHPVGPNADIGTFGTVLVRVMDGTSWETASYRFERLYPSVLLGGDPGIAPNLQMGTEPLVLDPVPEPSLPVLAVLGFALLICRFKLGSWKEGSIDLPSVSSILRARISGRDISYDEPRWESRFTRTAQTEARDAACLSFVLPARPQPVAVPPHHRGGFSRWNCGGA